ncbi:MAG TPA: hypothetical protein VG371_11410 [Solirubrobacteraceae bacterium]|nr:hypothetical protein [Solirubrobacteraceae bacterium]
MNTKSRKVVWVQSQRTQLEAELAPAYGSRRRRAGRQMDESEAATAPGRPVE